MIKTRGRFFARGFTDDIYASSSLSSWRDTYWQFNNDTGTARSIVFDTKIASVIRNNLVDYSKTKAGTAVFR